ncbi:hypothetical protein [Frankia sp. EAN1pec]|uniref:hypothetical protein n=1 Tax=Parafrankia sp. (strain EAN1pec) TaxID=298653 RepID=UPI00059E94E9
MMRTVYYGGEDEYGPEVWCLELRAEPGWQPPGGLACHLPAAEPLERGAALRQHRAPRRRWWLLGG